MKIKRRVNGTDLTYPVPPRSGLVQPRIYRPVYSL